MFSSKSSIVVPVEGFSAFTEQYSYSDANIMNTFRVHSKFWTFWTNYLVYLTFVFAVYNRIQMVKFLLNILSFWRRQMCLIKRTSFMSYSNVKPPEIQQGICVKRNHKVLFTFNLCLLIYHSWHLRVTDLIVQTITILHCLRFPRDKTPV